MQLMNKLVLLRHGQSQWNLENRFTGWVDVDLSNKGREEAKKSGQLIKKLNIPCLFTWNTMDFLPFSHKLNYGRPGNVAIRSSNFIIQNADLYIFFSSQIFL